MHIRTHLCRMPSRSSSRSPTNSPVRKVKSDNKSDVKKSRSRSPDAAKKKSRSPAPKKKSRSRSPATKGSKSRSPVRKRDATPPNAKTVICRVTVGNLTRNVGGEHLKEIFGTFGYAHYSAVAVVDAVREAYQRILLRASNIIPTRNCLASCLVL